MTPPHIVPEWYFLPFYAILRSVPDKLGGVVAMISAILVLFLLPIINTSEVRSSKFRPIFRCVYWFLVSDFIILGWIGQKPVESPFIEVGMYATIFYFLFMLVLVPSIGILEKDLVEMKKLEYDVYDDWPTQVWPWVPPYDGEDYDMLPPNPKPYFDYDEDDPRNIPSAAFKVDGNYPTAVSGFWTYREKYDNRLIEMY